MPAFINPYVPAPGPTRFERVLEAREGTFGIANEQGGFFARVYCHVDEWDNVCGRGITWTADWKDAHTYKTKAGARRKMRQLASLTGYKMHVVG